MKNDREMQKRILIELAKIYPGSHSNIQDAINTDEVAHMFAQLVYLDEHGLIVNGYEWPSGYAISSKPTTITAKGIDFLEDDGGLSAILNTVTVRLDVRQFAELLASKVEKLPSVAPEERSELATAIRKLPATAVEKIAEKLLNWSVDHAGDVLPLLRGLVGMAA